MPAIACGVSSAPCHLSPFLTARSPPLSQIIEASTYQAWPGRYSGVNLGLLLLAAASFWPSWIHSSIEVGGWLMPAALNRSVRYTTKRLAEENGTANCLPSHWPDSVMPLSQFWLPRSATLPERSSM